ncbi:hypothetical protein EZJ49_11485 [Bdellovibrio bacteriovorus]|uniref:hypothetical protein n=1 Tax=Bdellovibrio bacteriovorus TaxID=959 RepID=UPI0021D2AC14|nr:hypothetical protein [Bdellovibrio bacteriovorus]UXR63694.1 hypothetical protein EZJ49_11485 [Bdellovibrio bacteriovorus]
MSKKIFALVAVMMTSLYAGTSLAATANGVMLTANAFMYNTTVEVTPGTKSESKVSIYDIKLGYLSGNGLYLGGIYTLRNSEAGNSSSDGNAMGASIGYVGSSGFYVKGHYLVSAELGDNKEGTGIQGDFGYLTNITGALVVGVELTYRSIEYKKNDTAPTMEKLKQDELFPMLTVGFVF